MYRAKKKQYRKSFGFIYPSIFSAHIGKPFKRKKKKTNLKQAYNRKKT